MLIGLMTQHAILRHNPYSRSSMINYINLFFSQ